jgi:hypothetical protein
MTEKLVPHVILTTWLIEMGYTPYYRWISLDSKPKAFVQELDKDASTIWVMTGNLRAVYFTGGHGDDTWEVDTWPPSNGTMVHEINFCNPNEFEFIKGKYGL